MRHAFQIIAASALLLTVSAAPALSDQNCKPVIGHFEAFVVPPGQGHCPPDPAAFCTSGRVWGGMQGSYQFIMTGSYLSALINGVPTILFFTGTSTIFMKNGEQVVGTDTGSLDLPPGQGGFASLITFSGGTGSMSGAAGQIRLRGEFSAAEGTTSGDYIGSLCLP